MRQNVADQTVSEHFSTVVTKLINESYYVSDEISFPGLSYLRRRALPILIYPTNSKDGVVINDSIQKRVFERVI